MSLIRLIKTKNRCFDRFVEESQRFIAQGELGDFSGLDRLQQRRDLILRAISMCDRKINEEVVLLNPSERTEELIGSIRELLQLQDHKFTEVTQLDVRISRLLENEQNRLTTEVSQSRQSVSLMKKFKSTWIAQAGGELDEKL
ncbi:hypothetical protein WDW86_09770 [Bdellovibrionota bacterium FG-2]